MLNLHQTLVVTLLMIISFSLQAEIEISESLDGLTNAEKAWLLDDSGLDALAVSSKRFKWSHETTNQDYWLRNELTITPNSLETGWIDFHQCHYQLDAVSKVEIHYPPDITQHLNVVITNKLCRHHVLNNTVQLQQVRKGASICVTGASRTLSQKEGVYSIKRGPYMRKFFDGYFPMIVEETLTFDKVTIQLTGVSPSHPSPDHSIQGDHFQFNFHFEGILTPLYEFKVTE